MLITNQNILELSKEGLSCSKIAKITGLSYHAVYHELNKKLKGKNPLSQANKEKAYEAYLNGMLAPQIAKEFNITQQIIKNYIAERREQATEEQYKKLQKLVCMAWR